MKNYRGLVKTPIRPITSENFHLIFKKRVPKKLPSVCLTELEQLKTFAQNVPTERTALFVYFLPTKCSDGTNNTDIKL